MAAEARATARLVVDPAAVVANWLWLQDRVAPARCAAVVKADAYGLGAALVAPGLAAAGCTQFFVATLDEGIRLRAVLDRPAIAVLGGVPAGAEPECLAHRLVPVLNHLGDLAAWRRFGADRGEPRPAWVHLDTGMNRLGLGPDEQGALLAKPALLEGIALAGWISHLACADEPDHPLNTEQRARFGTLLGRLPPAPASFANSAGIFRGRAFHFDLVRPGVALYGVNPTPEATNPMRPVLRLDARVLQVRPVDRTMTIGYGAAGSIGRPGRIATLGLGYADGYLRSLGGKGAVFFGGIPAPVVGRVSMDLITVDVTDLPEAAVRPGVWAEVIGPSRSVDQVAAEAGTIGYEILTGLGERFLRVTA